MKIKKICVIGGAGFVGSSIVSKLDAAGYQVKVLTRHRERAKHLILLPNVQVETCNIHNASALIDSLRGSDAVINLVGILHESKRNTFESIHHHLPKRIATLCNELTISRFIHMSALGSSEQAPSEYLRSKARGEVALSEFRGGVDMTIFGPSVIFGRGDSFITLFASLIKFLPVIFLAKPRAKFQPVWVEDVATVFVNSIQNTDTYAKHYNLVGPKVYNLRELVQKTMLVMGKKRPIIGLNDTLSYLQAWFMELLPVKLMTRDNVRSMEVDSVSEIPMAKEIAMPMMSLEAVMPEYIINKTPRAVYDQFRTAAGRVINARR
ncbi:MAG: complex I NDUFA9 subunit family protein [Methylophilaceae bacterium]